MSTSITRGQHLEKVNQKLRTRFSDYGVEKPVLTPLKSIIVSTSKKVNIVYETYDYSIFDRLDGNRNINLSHVADIEASFKEKHLMSPILVNEKLQVIDGQHRLLASKRCKVPIRFIIVEGYDLEEIRILNVNAKNWGKKDYLDSYCEQGFPEYIKLKQFMGDYPQFSLDVCEFLTTNKTISVNHIASRSEGGRVDKRTSQNFQEGYFEVGDLALAYENAEKIMDFKPYFKGYHTSFFVKAIIGILKKSYYDHNQMLDRLEAQPGKLEYRGKVSKYKELLEEIYNYRSRNKVSFKY